MVVVVVYMTARVFMVRQRFVPPTNRHRLDHKKGETMGLDLNLNKPLALVGIVLGAIVTLLLLAAFVGPLFDATQSITENFTEGDTGNEQANAILPIFAFIIPIAVIVGIVGLVLVAVSFSRSD